MAYEIIQKLFTTFVWYPELSNYNVTLFVKVDKITGM